MNVDLEVLSENIANECEELKDMISELRRKHNKIDAKEIADKLNPIKSNILHYVNTLFEVIKNPIYNEDDVDMLRNENELLKELLKKYISEEEIIYLRIKYDLEV